MVVDASREGRQWFDGAVTVVLSVAVSQSKTPNGYLRRFRLRPGPLLPGPSPRRLWAFWWHWRQRETMRPLLVWWSWPARVQPRTPHSMRPFTRPVFFLRKFRAWLSRSRRFRSRAGCFLRHRALRSVSLVVTARQPFVPLGCCVPAVAWSHAPARYRQGSQAA